MPIPAETHANTRPDTPPSMGDKINISIALMLAAYLCFALSDTTTKAMVLYGMPVFQLAFVRYVVQFTITLGEVSVRGIRREEITQNWALLLLRGVVLAIGTVLTFISFRYLSLTMISAILFLAPTYVSLLSWPLLGERVGPWRRFAIIFGFAGVLVIIRPFNQDYHWAAILPMIVALCLAMYSILTRKLAHRVRPHVMQFVVGAFGSVVLLPLAVLVWQPVEWRIAVGMVFVGCAAWFGHEMLTRAHKMTPASVLMPYSYSFIVYMSVTGFIVFGEVPDIWVLVGTGIIVVSGLIIWQRERIKPARPS